MGYWLGATVPERLVDCAVFLLGDHRVIGELRRAHRVLCCRRCNFWYMYFDNERTMVMSTKLFEHVFKAMSTHIQPLCLAGSLDDGSFYNGSSLVDNQRRVLLYYHRLKNRYLAFLVDDCSSVNESSTVIPQATIF